MRKKNFSISDIKLKEMPGQIDNVVAGFGGMALGKIASHFLDKTIKSPTVSGLVGV